MATFATIAPCAHIARLFNDVAKFSIFKINLSYFPSRARLNFRWIFKEFDLKSNMKGFFENFLALSVKKLKKVLMILPSISGRGRTFPAESCRYMPCLVISNLSYLSSRKLFVKVGNSNSSQRALKCGVPQ